MATQRTANDSLNGCGGGRADTELALRAGEEEACTAEVAEHTSLQSAGGCASGCCCACVRRRPRLTAAILVLCLVVTALVYSTLPQYIVNSRFAKAHFSIGQLVLNIEDNASYVMHPSIQVFASKDLLQVPFVSFTAHVLPFNADVYVYTKAVEIPGEPKQQDMLVKIGNFHVSNGVNLDSSKDVDLDLEAAMTITGLDYIGQVVNDFLTEDKLPAVIKGRMDVVGKAWGWFPVYIWDISVSYSLQLPAFNNFKTHQMQLDDILNAHGTPHRLAVECRALVFNPSPITIITHDTLKLSVGYAYLGSSFTVGELLLLGLELRPGMNTPSATLTVVQNSSNENAIRGMLTAYMGGRQHGFDPAGTKEFAVDIHDRGAATSSSELMRRALLGLSVRINFRPKPLYFLKAITADITVLGSFFKWPPQAYKAVLHVTINNPLPQGAELRGVKVDAYTPQLPPDGRRVYRFDHVIDPPMVLPPQVDTILDFDLAMTEIIIPNSFADIVNIIWESTVRRKVKLGITGVFNLIVDPAFEQLIDYENDGIEGQICYHLHSPTQRCGSMPNAMLDNRMYTSE